MPNTTMISSLATALAGEAPASPAFSREREVCGAQISAKRLAAVPGARRCRDCQATCDLSPVEQFGSAKLARAIAVGGERDGGQFQVGGDCSAW